jgi:hypothetical protein
VSIPTKSLLKGLHKEVQTLEQRHGAEMPASAIKNKALRELASPVSTGCASTAMVKTDQLKRALQTVGKDIERADANKDGRLNVGEQRRLSPLAARLLQAAGNNVASPDEPAPRPSVSTGCGASVTPSPPAVTPRPTPSVSTGCGGGAPVRPIRTGC